jgi:hypothetical protein
MVSRSMRGEKALFFVKSRRRLSGARSGVRSGVRRGALLLLNTRGVSWKCGGFGTKLGGDLTQSRNVFVTSNFRV